MVGLTLMILGLGCLVLHLIGIAFYVAPPPEGTGGPVTIPQIYWAVTFFLMVPAGILVYVHRHDRTAGWDGQA